MTLHTLNKTTSNLLKLCISALAAGDSLLLYEDGIYAAMGNAENQQVFLKLPAGIKLYTLIEDMQARGITDKVPEIFSRITYRDFVRLSLSCSKVVNWN
jgi:tRNA 2-thiouridine synthesizing protein B